MQRNIPLPSAIEALVDSIKNKKPNVVKLAEAIILDDTIEYGLCTPLSTMKNRSLLSYALIKFNNSAARIIYDLSVEHGHFKVKERNIFTPDNDGRNALFYAAQKNQTELFFDLINLSMEHNFDLKQPWARVDTQENTCLHLAAASLNYNLICKLFNYVSAENEVCLRYVNRANRTNAGGNTALYNALNACLELERDKQEFGNGSVLVALLINKGTDVQQVNGLKLSAFDLLLKCSTNLLIAIFKELTDDKKKEIFTKIRSKYTSEQSDYLKQKYESLTPYMPLKNQVQLRIAKDKRLRKEAIAKFATLTNKVEKHSLLPTVFSNPNPVPEIVVDPSANESQNDQQLRAILAACSDPTFQRNISEFNRVQFLNDSLTLTAFIFWMATLALFLKVFSSLGQKVQDGSSSSATGSTYGNPLASTWWGFLFCMVSLVITAKRLMYNKQKQNPSQININAIKKMLQPLIVFNQSYSPEALNYNQEALKNKLDNIANLWQQLEACVSPVDKVYDDFQLTQQFFTRIKRFFLNIKYCRDDNRFTVQDNAPQLLTSLATAIDQLRIDLDAMILLPRNLFEQRVGIVKIEVVDEQSIIAKSTAQLATEEMIEIVEESNNTESSPLASQTFLNSWQAIYNAIKQYLTFSNTTVTSNVSTLFSSPPERQEAVDEEDVPLINKNRVTATFKSLN